MHKNLTVFFWIIFNQSAYAFFTTGSFFFNAAHRLIIEHVWDEPWKMNVNKVLWLKSVFPRWKSHYIINLLNGKCLKRRLWVCRLMRILWNINTSHLRVDSDTGQCRGRFWGYPVMPSCLQMHVNQVDHKYELI